MKTKLTVRKLDFAMQMKVKPHWFNDNIFSTHLMNSYHVVFPVGEKYFMRHVKWAMNLTDNEHDREMARKFIGQEQQHGYQHELFHEVLESQGLSAGRFARFIHAIWNWFDGVVGRIFGKGFLLAITAGMEHFTAIFAESAFDRRLTKGVTPHLRDMLRWHSAEEVEHKAVAYDLMQMAGVGYFRRIIAFVFSTVVMFGFALIGLGLFLVQDRTRVGLLHPHLLVWHFITFILSWAPSVLRQLVLIPLYLLPGFHPNQISPPAEVTSFLESGLDDYQRVAEQAA